MITTDNNDELNNQEQNDNNTDRQNKKGVKKVIKKKIVIKKKKKSSNEEEPNTNNDNNNTNIKEEVPSEINNNEDIPNQENNENEQQENEILNESLIKQKEAEYIAQIEQLQNELQIERQITSTIQTDPLIDEEIIRLRSLISLKTSKLTHLAATNEKQANALTTLKKEVQKQMQKHQVTQHKSEISKENPIDIVLRVKNKELNNALALIDVLSKDNAQMKKTIDQNGEYHSKLELIDTGRIKEDKIKKLKSEVDTLTKELESHKQCLKEKSEFVETLENIKKEIANEKNQHLLLRKEFKDIEDKNKAITLKGTIKKENKINKDNNNNITSIKGNNNITQINNNNNKVNGLLNEEIKKKLKEIMNQKEDDYNLLIEKIETLQNIRDFLDKKHKGELKQFINQITEFHKEIDTLSNQGKELETSNKIIQFSLNDIKKEHKGYQKKILSYQSQLDKMQKISKEKDQEIKLLTHQLNSLRKIIKHGTVDPLETEVTKYIEKIKMENK